MTHSAKVTSKGQITIPAAIRAELKLKKGDEVQFFQSIDGSIVLSAKNLNFADSAGYLKDLPDAEPSDDPLVLDDDRIRNDPTMKAAKA